MPNKDEVAREIVSIIVPILAKKPHRQFTYGELCKLIAERYGTKVNPHQGPLNSALFDIQESCLEVGVPGIGICVVQKTGGAPGEGWYPTFDRRYPDLAGQSRAEKRRHATEEVGRCLDWSPLLEHYGLDSEPLPSNPSPEELRWGYLEGASSQSESIRQELTRSLAARKRCLELLGTRCLVCGFDSGEAYGIPGVIDVHHLRPIHDGERETDPERDLIPVCPTCHRIIHSKPGGGAYTPEEVREMLRGHGPEGARPLS